MSTTPARGRVSPSSASVSPDLGQNKVPPAPRPDPDRRLCAFTFSSGHQCRMPRRAGHPYLCFFHARKEAQALAADNVGEEIANYLSGAYVSACDLNNALGRLFVAVAQGLISPKTASTLAYLAQSLVQALHLAQHEYINAFGTDAWRSTIRSSFPPPDPPPSTRPPSTPAPTTPPPPPSSPSPFTRPPHSSPADPPAPVALARRFPGGAAPPSRGHGNPTQPNPSTASPTTTQPSAGGASNVSPARKGWDASPGPSPSAGGAAQSPTVDRQPPTACPEPFGVNSPATPLES